MVPGSVVLPIFMEPLVSYTPTVTDVIVPPHERVPRISKELPAVIVFGEVAPEIVTGSLLGMTVPAYFGQ